MRKLAFALVLILSLTPLFAQTSPKKASEPKAPVSSRADELPVTRVVLYKNGVGYFEHAGRVRGSQEVNIDFTTGQLNDVLKSLTVVDLGGGQITGVRYNSIAPLGERLRTLRVQLGENTTREQFLNALRGARVEVRSGTASAIGKLLSVETITQQVKDAILQKTEIAVMTDSGEMRSFELTPATSVRILEGDLSRDIGQYLNAIGTSRAKDVRRMTIGTSGNGERNVFVSYISEVPVWKSTYRILLPSKAGEKPLLQGWAIVDNTVGEDWNNVQLSLVAGAPQSFIQQISQPYYLRRPTVELPKSAMLTPQTHEGTLELMAKLNEAPPPPPPPGVAIPTGTLWGSVTDPSGAVIPNARVTIRNDVSGATQTTTSDSQGKYRFNNVQAGNSVLYVESAGFQRFELSNIYLGANRTNEISARLNVGSSSEAVEVTAASPRVDAAMSMVSSVVSEDALAAVESQAASQKRGELFEYSLKLPITVSKNQSALVPIANARIEAEKVTLWNLEDEQALHSLWIKNISDLTLDAGTFNVIDGTTFAGEGVFETLYPNERRLLSYAEDKSIHVTARGDEKTHPATRVRIAKGVMIVTHEQRATKVVKVRNNDTKSRDVIIEDKAEPGWKLAEGLKPEESTANFNRFRVTVAPASTASLTIEAVHPEDARYEISNIDSDEVAVFVRDKSISPLAEQAIRRVLAKENTISEVEAQLKTRNAEITRINADQTRMRENMKALKGSAEEKSLIQRYVQTMNQHEDRLNALNKEIESLDAQRTKLNSELETMIQEISLDEKI